MRVLDGVAVFDRVGVEVVVVVCDGDDEPVADDDDVAVAEEDGVLVIELEGV